MKLAQLIIGLFSFVSLAALLLWAIKDLWIIVLLILIAALASSIWERKA